MLKTANIGTGRVHVFVLTSDLVHVRLEWPVELVDRLSDDFKLTLSGPQILKQEQPKSAPREDGLVWFEFEWDSRTKEVQLEASGDGKTILLWRQQVAGNLDAQIDWEERLHSMLSEPPVAEPEEQDDTAFESEPDSATRGSDNAATGDSPPDEGLPS